MSDNISTIKDRLSIVDLISGYIKVQKAGANYKARCPFHNEKTPSFYISPERQIWHCFGCSAGGDIFGFIKQIEGVEFPEALRILAQRAGVQLERFDPKEQDAKTVLFDICEAATRFFEKQLHHSPEGKIALIYLKERGLLENTIKDFRIGFSPDGWRHLSDFLHQTEYSDEDIVKAGMAIKREDGNGIYDRFRSRIIFPIADLNDRVVGFTGRVFDTHRQIQTTIQTGAEKVSISQHESVAKYINTPQTLIYDKSRILYGLNMARMEVRRADKVVLVEGNMDAIMSYQAGIQNVAATSGTALTPSHLQLLQRYTANLDFCCDTDQAGLVATRRGIGLALSQNLNVKIISLQDPDCKDPADYVKKFGSKWQEITKSAKPAVEFYFDKLKSELDIATIDSKKAIIASLSPLIKRLSSQVEKAHWISKIAAAFKTKEDNIEHDIMSAKDDLEIYADNRQDVSSHPQDKLPPKLTADDLLNEAILAVILRKPQLFKEEISKIDTLILNSETARTIGRLNSLDLSTFYFSDFVKTFDGPEALKIEFAMMKSQELLKNFSDKDLLAEFNNINNQINKRAITAQLANLEFDIKAAETSGDKAVTTTLLANFNELSKKLAN